MGDQHADDLTTASGPLSSRPIGIARFIALHGDQHADDNNRKRAIVFETNWHSALYRSGDQHADDVYNRKRAIVFETNWHSALYRSGDQHADDVYNRKRGIVFETNIGIARFIALVISMLVI